MGRKWPIFLYGVPYVPGYLSRPKFTPCRIDNSIIHRNSYKRYMSAFEKSGCETKRGHDLFFAIPTWTCTRILRKQTEPNKQTDPIKTRYVRNPSCKLQTKPMAIADSGRGGSPSKFRWLIRAQMPDFGHITGIYTDTKLPAIYFVCSSYV